MIEILLIQEKINDSIQLMTHINELNPNIRVYTITNNISTCLPLLNNHIIDIIIIDYINFHKINLTDFYQFNDKVKFFIILGNNNINSIPTNCIFSNKNTLLNDLDVILKKMDIIKNDYREIIWNELKYLGYNPAYYGTKYLIDCIYYLYKNCNIYDDNSLTNVYPIISKKYNKPINNIKCNITRATSIMFCECEENKLKEYLGTCTIPKTGSRIIIQTILNKLNNL